MYFIVYVFAMLTYIKSKTSSTSLTDGTKTKITGGFNPHDIYIHSFNCSTSQVDFFLEIIEGSPLMYSYHSNYGTNFNPSEKDLIYLSLSNSLEKAKIIDTTMILKLNLLKANNANEDDQIVIIVYKFQIWILIAVLSFVAVFGLIGLITCLLYKQIQQVKIEDENSEDIEILDHSTFDLFPEEK